MARKALKDLDDKLAKDNATGHIERNSEKLILIPGRSRLTEGKTGPIEEAGELGSEIIQIGGRDERINVHLRVGD